MLIRHPHASLALSLVLPAALFVGCVVTSDDTDPTSSSSSSSSSASSSGTGGAGGAGGEGGQGGAGGQGGTCVDAAGTNKTVADCDMLNISPTQGASRQCAGQPDQDPYGYRLCKGGFALFSQGQAEDLLACLGKIDVRDSCDFDQANNCTNEMYENSCSRPQAASTCNQIATSCRANEPLDIADCTADLQPFSGAGDQLIVACMNEDAQLAMSCQDAYTFCYEDRTSF